MIFPRFTYKSEFLIYSIHRWLPVGGAPTNFLLDVKYIVISYPLPFSSCLHIIIQIKSYIIFWWSLAQNLQNIIEHIAGDYLRTELIWAIKASIGQGWQ